MNRKNAQPYELMASTPCDIFFVSCPSDFVLKLPKDPSCESFALNYPDCGFRGVSIDSLPAVLQQGIDVVPTNDVIFVDDLDKALEYGGWPKVLLALRWSSLKCTFKHLPADSSKEKVEKVENGFREIPGPRSRLFFCLVGHKTRLLLNVCYIKREIETSRIARPMGRSSVFVLGTLLLPKVLACRC